MPRGWNRRWQVWSLDPRSGRWMVVDEAREEPAKGAAARRMNTARKRHMVGAAYVALPPDATPDVTHQALAVTEDEAPPSDAGLAGAAVTTDEGAENMRKTAQLTLTGSGTLPTPTGQASITASGSRTLDPTDAIEPFAPDAFAHVVGHAIPMRLGPGDIRWVRIAAADVAEDGASMTLRLEPADGPDEAGLAAADGAAEETCPHGTPLTAPHCQRCDGIRDGIAEAELLGEDE